MTHTWQRSLAVALALVALASFDEAGKAKTLFQQPDSYVWSLAVDGKDGTIYAGTGPRGRVYKINPDGTSSLFYQTKQDHVLCLTLGPDGHLYAGTDKNGLVYRI